MPPPTRERELTERLIEGLAALDGSDSWRRFLEVQGRFHRYSAGNVLLIASQREDATQVAGYATWRRLGRRVRRGERAIWILAPVVRRPIGDADAVSGEVCAFRWVAVFDVSQTEGEPLPEVCARLEGGDPRNHYRSLVAVAATLGFRVEEHVFAGATSGDCSHAARRIRIDRETAPAQRVKTLAHELAHAVLHESFSSRSDAELEAESVAYIVCQQLGIDTSAYSFGYLSSWAGDSERAIASVRARCERIQRGAARLIEELERSSGADRRSEIELIADAGDERRDDAEAVASNEADAPLHWLFADETSPLDLKCRDVRVESQ